MTRLGTRWAFVPDFLSFMASRSRSLSLIVSDFQLLMIRGSRERYPPAVVLAETPVAMLGGFRRVRLRVGRNRGVFAASGASEHNQRNTVLVALIFHADHGCTALASVQIGLNHSKRAAIRSGQNGKAGGFRERRPHREVRNGNPGRRRRQRVRGINRRQSA
jgi:hypothetical protein